MCSCTRRLRVEPSGPRNSRGRPLPSRAKPSQRWASSASGVSGTPCSATQAGEAHSHHSSVPSRRAAQVESARRPKRTARSMRALIRSIGASSTSNRRRSDGCRASSSPSAGATCRAKPTGADRRSSPLGASREAANSARAWSAAAHRAAHCAWTSWPASVSASLRVERCSSVTPPSRSSRRTCWLTADGLIPSARPAPLMEPCCTTLANTAMRLRSSISAFLCRLLGGSL